jgi:hypothetical protein
VLREPYGATLDRQFGYGPHRCRRGIDGLKKLYPPAICRRLLLSDPYFHDLYFLFENFLPSPILHLLQLGESIEIAWPISRRWLERLRRPDGFAAAAVEVDVLADLVSAGYRVEPEPRVGRGKADLLTFVDYQPYYIEVKHSQHSDVDRVRRFIEQRVFEPTPVVLFGFRAELRASPEWRGLSRSPRGRATLKANAEAMGKVIHELIETLARESRLVGVHSARPYGDLVITSLDDPNRAQFGSDDLVPIPTSKERCSRIVEQVAAKAEQMPVGDPKGFIHGAIVVDAGFAADLDEIEQQVRYRIGAEPIRFRGCEMIVIRSKYRESDDNFRIRRMGRVIPTFRNLARQEHALATALAGSDR